MKLKRTEQYAVIFGIIMILWGIYSFVSASSINSEVIATFIVLILLGITYPLSIFVPGWIKAAILADGVVFLLVALFLLSYPSKIVFLILGICLIVLSILAYVQKLPRGLLKFFYRQ